MNKTNKANKDLFEEETVTAIASATKNTKNTKDTRGIKNLKNLKNIKDKYDASSIEVLVGLDPVRKRPGMYTDTSSPRHLVQEVIDNGVDEAISGHAKNLTVEILPDNRVRVTDDGRGLPVDIHPEHGVTGVELIFTRLHSGAKFSDKNYIFSGGLHGVGVSVVNALSEELIAEIWKNGKKYRMSFRHGEKQAELEETENSDPPRLIGGGEKGGRGTRITFRPCTDYFDSPNFSVSYIIHLLRAKAVLCPGLRTSFTDHTHQAAGKRNPRHTQQTWLYKGGIREYIQEMNGDILCLPAEPVCGETHSAERQLSWGVQWTLEDDPTLTETYVNLIPTILGGTHVTSFRSGLYEGIKQFCEYRNLLPKDTKLSSEDIWKNCGHVLSVMIRNPHFAGQTKERLTSQDQTAFIAGEVKQTFLNWLNTHSQTAEKIVLMVIENARERARQANIAKKNKQLRSGGLPGKLADCISKKPEERELFLVEGDSAGGSAKQARDKNTQAVLPLRGKILNTWELDGQKILESNEILDIIRAIGVMPKAEDLGGLRYDKICILADADSDGMHIAALLCALFIKHFPQLVRERHMYVAMPPLYRIDRGNSVFYALDDVERKKILSGMKGKGKVDVQRFKGLGEMNARQLRETTMAPATRRLLQLETEDESEIQQRLPKLFAKKLAAERREWLEEKGDLISL